MSFKRRVLSALVKDVLLEIDRGLELDVTTRMSAEELRDVLAKSKRAKLEAIVHQLDPKDPRWFSTDRIEPPPVGS